MSSCSRICEYGTFGASSLIPSHSLARRFHVFSESRFPVHQGKVLHCVGLTSYIRHFFLFRKMQSYDRGFSSSEYLLPTLLTYFAIKSSIGIPMDSAIAFISFSVTHTYPGAPVQHSPHPVHLNLRPSLYQGLSLLLIVKKGVEFVFGGIWFFF